MRKHLQILLLLATICSGTLPVLSNPLLDGADPDVLVDQSKYWLYPTTEPGEQNKLFAYSSDDLQHWTKTTPLLTFKDISWLNQDKAPWHALWAPGIFKEGDKYFLFYAVGPQHPTLSRIGVATSNMAQGPFVDSGAPLVTGDNNFEAIDPMAFKDPKTGKVYLYCGGSAGPEMRVYELDDKRLRVAKRLPVDTPENFTEAPFMHLRGSTYYMSYSNGKWNDDSYSVAYSTANSPLGPWTFRGKILRTDERHAGPGHHSIFQNPNTGEWFIAYHRWNNAKRDGKLPPARSLAIEPLTYDENGLIRQVQMTDEKSPLLRDSRNFLGR